MNSRDTNVTTAIVARGPASAGLWQLEAVVPRPLKDDEVLVSMVASGICLADIHFGDAVVGKEDGHPAIYYPRVLGHEGESRTSMSWTNGGSIIRATDMKLTHH